MINLTRESLISSRHISNCMVHQTASKSQGDLLVFDKMTQSWQKVQYRAGSDLSPKIVYPYPRIAIGSGQEQE